MILQFPNFTCSPGWHWNYSHEGQWWSLDRVDLAGFRIYTVAWGTKEFFRWTLPELIQIYIKESIQKALAFDAAMKVAG